ncbi:MAG: MATE family efflux transporter [Treponema sp.]|nr:MATE family efflux transporter [Treponema sp.]
MKQGTDEYKRRQFLLNGNPLAVIFSVTLPLLFHNSLNLIFSFFDTFTAAHMSMNVVTTVSFAGDIRTALGTISGGLSVGAGIMISRSFGRGDDEEVQSQISTVFFIAVIVALVLFALVIPFSLPILRLCAFPEEMLYSGSVFLAISVLTLIFSFINTIFFATEKARGRTKIVMYGNLIVLGVKTLLNAIIIVLVSSGSLEISLAMYLLPLASGLAFGTMTFVAIKRLFSKDNLYRVQWKCTAFRKAFLLPLAKVSFPVFVEKFLVPFGKVICNGLYVGFGSVGVAAYSCSQRICALASTPLNSFKDAESNIVSANLGNRNAGRAVTFLIQTTIVTLATEIILFTLLALFSEPLIYFFAKGNEEMASGMRIIYRIERWAAFFDAIDGAACGFLYARKKTKLPTIVNIVKLFGIRIPLFILLTRVYGFGIEAIAWSIFASNGADALLSVIFVLHAVVDLKRVSAIEESNNEKLFAAISALGHWDAFDEGQTRRHGITIPLEVLETMREKFSATLTANEMSAAYKEAIVAARIEALEKEENEAAW